MSNLKKVQIIDDLFNKFEAAIEINNSNQINKILSLTLKAENEFLNSYHKRKKEGVYYTNLEICNFMFYESLLFLLDKRIKTNKLNDIKIIFKLEDSKREVISNILLKLKICDPACGSGAFLLSAADILFSIIKKLNPNLEPKKIKIQIINNLFGFDINESAIKLSFLKLFNWYYCDENSDISPILTHLHDNLRVENRIISDNNDKYDLIIGNPPYGNILSENEKVLLKQEELFYKDVYCTFLYKAIDWSKGIIGFLVPKSFLIRQGYVKFRNKFLSKVNIKKIFDIGPNLFKMATNEVQIIFYEKNEKNDETIEIYDYPNKEIIRYKYQEVDNLRICFNIKCPMCEKSKKIYIYTQEKICPYCLSKTFKLNRIRIKPTPILFKLIEKIETLGDLNCLNIKDFPKMIRGEEDKGLREIKKLIKNNLKGTCFFVNAKNDFGYYYIHKNKSFNIEQVSPIILKGNDYEYYKGAKLLIKHNNIIPEAIYTEDCMCFTSSIYSLLHSDINELKYLCAILNSSIIQFYCIFGINNQKDTTINLNQYMIRHLPIIKPNSQIKSELTKKVEEIINLLEVNNGKMEEEVCMILREIDTYFFNLYSLTDEERKIIISNVKNKIEYFKVIYSNV